MGFAKGAAESDPVLNPLLERLAFLETANDGLKSRLSTGGFNTEMQNLALREQLASARAEVARQQEALESFCRETLAAGQARDQARAAAEQNAAALAAAVDGRDALLARLETLEVDLELSSRGALDADARRLVRDLEAELESTRRAARETEREFRESSRQALESAQAETSARLKALTAEFAEREARLNAVVEDGRRRLAETELKLEAARRGEQDAQSALRESARKTDDETAERRRLIAEEAARREAPLLKIIENDRRLLETLKLDLERARLGEREAALALRESEKKAQALAEERLAALTKASADREVSLLKTGEDDRRRLAELTVELERARRRGKDSEENVRESVRKSIQEAQSDAAERLRALTQEYGEQKALMLAAAANDRRRLEALELELGQARLAARKAEQALLESSRKSVQDDQSGAAARLHALTAGFDEREAILLKTAANDLQRVEAMALEIERTRLGAQEAVRALHESEAEGTNRLRALANEFKEREALILQKAADDRMALEAMRFELDAARAAARKEAPNSAPEDSELPPDAPPAAGTAAAFVSPSLEPALDPGWSRLLRLVRPPVEAAYAHLRRLSSTALTSGQKTLLRMAAASVASASDSLSSIELALQDGPAPGAPAPVAPVLETCLAAWEAAFRGRGVALAREFSTPLPETAHDPKELRIALQHVLRNVLEAVPRGGRLAVRAWRAPDGGFRLEFVDDGPGFPAEWLARRFEPFAAPRRGRAGLGLSIVRRTLRRWGGDAEAANVRPGRGARLTLLFAPPAPPPPPAAPAK